MFDEIAGLLNNAANLSMLIGGAVLCLASLFIMFVLWKVGRAGAKLVGAIFPSAEMLRVYGGWLTAFSLVLGGLSSVGVGIGWLNGTPNAETILPVTKDAVLSPADAIKVADKRAELEKEYRVDKRLPMGMCLGGAGALLLGILWTLRTGNNDPRMR